MLLWWEGAMNKFKNLILCFATVVLIAFVANQAMVQAIVFNRPPFVTIAVLPDEGFINETFSIYVIAGDRDGYLTGATVTLNGQDVSSKFNKVNSTTWLYDYVPPTADNYVVVCTVYDNAGAKATNNAAFRVTEPVYSIRPIELHDELPKLTGWEDYDFLANMKGSDGKDYYVDFYLIYKPANTGISKIKLGNEPASIYFNGTENIIEEKTYARAAAESPITVQKYPDSAVYTLKQSYIEGRKIQWLNIQFTFQPPDLHIAKASFGNTYIELKFHARGTPFWYNEGNPFYQASLGTSMGYELFSQVEGVLVSDGNVVQLNGYGIYEHFWSDRWDNRHVGHMDWLFFSFDELSGIVYSMDGYTDGGIYLTKEKQYLVVNDFSVEYLNWAYNPAGQYYVPIEVSVTANTDSGILEVAGKAKGFQQMRLGSPEPYYNVADIRLSGTFTYSNGTATALNGSGWDQIILR